MTVCHIIRVLLLLANYYIIAIGASASDYADEDGIFVLTQSNFDKAVDNFKYLFVEFYAPWCGHCKALQPEYVKLGERLKSSDSEVRLGKVDATVEKSLAKKYAIRSYPTLMLFRQANAPITYTSGRKAAEMWSWLTTKASTTQTLRDVQTTKELIEKENFVAIGFFQDRAASSVFTDAAAMFDGVVFAITDNKEIFEEFSVDKDTIVLFKKFDEGRVQLDVDQETTVADVEGFIQSNRLPVVFEYNKETAADMLARGLDIHMLMFTSRSSPHHDDKMRQFRTVANQFKNKVLFVYVDVDNEDHQPLLNYFSISRAACPTYRVIYIGANIRYKPDADDPSDTQLVQFLNDVLAGKHKRFLMTEDIPEHWDEKPVKQLVGKNFVEVVNDKTKDVIVMLYSPSCQHCQALAPVWDELGDKYKDRDDVIIAKLDATENQVEGIDITYFPTIKLYPKGSDEVIDFPREVDKTLDRLSQFLELRGHLPQEDKMEDTAAAKVDGTKDEL